MNTLTLKMEAACISVTLVTVPTSTWCKNPRTELTSKFGVVGYLEIYSLVNVSPYPGKLSNQFAEFFLFLIFIQIPPPPKKNYALM
jgi:hypothetical protein